MAHGSPTSNTGNNATKKDGYPVTICSKVQNDAGTSHSNCHKSGTTGSLDVLDSATLFTIATYVELMSEARAYFQVCGGGLYQNLHDVDDAKFDEARAFAVQNGIATKHVYAFIEAKIGGAK